MIQIEQTEVFAKWYAKLKNKEARARINVRIRRVSLGNFGDFKSVGSGVSELKIDYGAGYRIYFTKKGEEIVILLAGGDKRTQEKDILKAIKLAENL
ncbi:MAG: type II toxin-antitoxin system RelE/ParE family toxin [Alphaproteobacteria bacterium]